MILFFCFLELVPFSVLVLFGELLGVVVKLGGLILHLMSLLRQLADPLPTLIECLTIRIK